MSSNTSNLNVEEVENLRARIATWLSGSGDEFLFDILQGFGLPPLGHEDEPYLWLLRALPDDDRLVYEAEIGARLGRLIHPGALHALTSASLPDKLVFNLLHLAAGLALPERLTEPVDLLINSKHPILRSDYLGIRARDSLRLAAIYNQIDDRWWPYWDHMLSGVETVELFGTVYDGLEGVRMMPEAADHRGEPALARLGGALGRLAQFLSKMDDRRIAFRFALERLVETYPGREWDLDLVHLADANNWPTWAVECLPSLVIPLGPRLGNGREFLLWNVFEEVLSRCEPIMVHNRLCNDKIIQVAVSGACEDMLNVIAPAIENGRIFNPWHSDRSSKVVARLAVLNELKSTELESEEADKLRVAAEALAV